MRSFTWSRFETSFGDMHAASTNAGLCRLRLSAEPEGSFFEWLEHHAEGGSLMEHRHAHERVRRQIDEFASGERSSFDIPLDLIGTPFQVRVWRELLAIPFGTTLSYGELARRVERPQGAQSVGRANGANPLPIIVPCHRVIGSDAALVGYAGGIEMKARLLRLEGAILV